MLLAGAGDEVNAILVGIRGGELVAVIVGPADGISVKVGIWVGKLVGNGMAVSVLVFKLTAKDTPIKTAAIIPIISIDTNISYTRN